MAVPPLRQISSALRNARYAKGFLDSLAPWSQIYEYGKAKILQDDWDDTSKDVSWSQAGMRVRERELEEAVQRAAYKMEVNREARKRVPSAQQLRTVARASGHRNRSFRGGLVDPRSKFACLVVSSRVSGM